MLESLSGSVAAYGRQVAPPTLSESQKSSVQGILSGYDAENLSKEDVQAIRAAFRAEGIRPSRDLKNAIEASGFDASELRSKGGPHGAGGHRPPPPPEAEEDAVSALLEILEDYEDETLDQNALTEIQSKLQEAGYPPRESYLELSV